MLGGLLKRLTRYSEAAECYARGLELDPGNLYMHVARAGLTLLSNPDDAAAFRKLYQDVRDLCDTPERAEDPWAFAAAGEACFVLCEDTVALQKFQQAYLSGDSPTILSSPADQLVLFAEAGFRPKPALDLEARLRAFGKEVGEKLMTRNVIAQPHLPARSLPVIVHLSDLHFGYRTDSDGNRVDMHRFVDDDDSITLQAHIRNELTSKNGAFRRFDPERLVLVISGDIAHQATPEEYKRALSFCESMVKDLPIGRERIIFCPGNHDVSWTDAGTTPARRFDNYLSFVHQFYGEELFRRMYPLVQWDFTVNGPRPEATDLMGVSYLEDHGLEIFSFNSCAYEKEEHQYGLLNLSRRQMDKLKAILERTAGEDRLRVAVVHHHIHPYPEQLHRGAMGDSSTIRDAGVFERFLERNEFDLVLHGHRHRSQLRQTHVRDPNAQDSQPLIVCGAGSCSVNSEVLDHAPNEYQVIEFLNAPRITHAEFLRVHVRELAVKPDAEWTTRQTWTMEG